MLWAGFRKLLLLKSTTFKCAAINQTVQRTLVKPLMNTRVYTSHWTVVAWPLISSLILSSLILLYFFSHTFILFLSAFFKPLGVLSLIFYIWYEAAQSSFQSFLSNKLLDPPWSQQWEKKKLVTMVMASKRYMVTINLLYTICS